MEEDLTGSIKKELDFEIIKEPWNKYKLEDGSILRIKNPILKFFLTDKLDNLGQPVYRVGGLNLISVMVPDELRGTPTPDQTINPSDIISEMKFEILSEDWCEYKLEDGTISKSKIVMLKIVKTNKFNLGGEPIYSCNWQILTDKQVPTKEKAQQQTF